MGLPERRLDDGEAEGLVTGGGRFAGDVGERPRALNAAVLRSPHAHAMIVGIDATGALSSPDVVAVLVGGDVVAWSEPFIAGVRQPVRHYALAVDRVRYAGEPVAVVLARDRYVAEDALERIEIEYGELDGVVGPVAAAAPEATLLHREVGSNVVSDRKFRYGNPDTAFETTEHRVGVRTHYPRNACTPVEGFVVVAEYLGDDGYDVLSNFQGPYSLHPVMARALGVPGSRLRLRSPPHSGGSFGVKQAIFPYIVAMCLASRKAGCPVKWVEDRLEHLLAATSATNRVTTLEAAVTADGTVTALRWDQLDDCGAYLRAPEPASLYRTHGHMTGPYHIPNLEIRNRVVLTNKTPTGLNRGFGGPQVYFALERLMHRIAKTLGLDPLDVIRRNLVPKEAFPYRAAAGSLLDSGDYHTALDIATGDGRLDRLRVRRAAARAEGRRYGIGFAAVVEPSISNMGYITMALTAEERARAGPKDGAAACATVAIDPIGSITVQADSVPQGQGHRTVLAQVVADALGVGLNDVTVNVELDTQKDPWSIAAGNYSSRFSGAVAGAAHLAAMKLRDRLARIASTNLNVSPDALEFAGGRIVAADNPENAVPLRRAAGIAHWSPGSLPEDAEPGLRETVFWSMPGLDPPDAEDRVNSSGAYGFIFDMCGVEIDDTGRVRIDEYVTMHDAGKRLNPALVDGQIRGGFAHGLGAALYEELAYDSDGSFLSGTFADYLVPTACEVPNPAILHMETPSPFTPLGAKGVGEGNAMSTPVCLANAVADALGIDDVDLPMTPAKVASWFAGEEPPPPARKSQR
ncbi:MAG: xanthine dehydrogenase family protein molybdopterin-binding subunit [Thiotrichales bacterium]|nr:xanthine dehydrogenase family protein molybdopterin-binding subunit [Thiotrichales bacterium]